MAIRSCPRFPHPPLTIPYGEISHPALAKVLCSSKHSQGHQSKVGEVRLGAFLEVCLEDRR